MAATKDYQPVWRIRVNRWPRERGIWFIVTRFNVGDVTYHRTVSIGLWFISIYRSNKHVAAERSE